MSEKNLRLNKVLKELNISIQRAVEFLQSKGIEVDPRPTTKIDDEVYSLLLGAFQKDRQQREAIEELVLIKNQEKQQAERLKEEEEAIQKEKIAIKAVAIVVEDKIELVEDKKEEDKKAVIPIEKFTEKEEIKPLPRSLTLKSRVELKGVTSLGKIDISKKEKPKKEEKPTKINPIKVVETEAPVVEEVALEKEIILPIETEEIKPDRMETAYQILEGPKLTGETIDLNRFKKPEPIKRTPDENKPKRKRITSGENKFVKPQDQPTTNTSQSNNTFKKPRHSGNNSFAKRSAPSPEITQEDIQKQIKDTLEKLTSKGAKSKGAKYRKDKRSLRREEEALLQEREDQDNTLSVTEFVTVSELASLMNVLPIDVISSCMSLGIMVTMNQRLEADTIVLVGEEFGFDIKFAGVESEELSLENENIDTEEDLLPRAPIVTIMGHVDHGKTSLLDYIRTSNVIGGEAGGITQHIGAYSVELENKQKITFLDTPGHEAFTAMRSRGAQVTDIVIIVVSADDEVMPQTKEAISHAQAASVPIIFAINKIDKPNANPEKIKEQLANLNFLVEEWGGTYQSHDISAKQGTGVTELLEKILLQAEMLELKANPNREASGTVVEATLDKGRGYTSTIIVQNGTLNVGDYVLAGKNHGKIKAMLDERGHNVSKALPSTPVIVLGLDGAPTAGDKFKVYSDEKEAKQLAGKRQQLMREQSIRTQKHITLDEIGRRIAIGDFKELNIILKGDVDGSVEALTDSLQKLSTEEIHINILFRGVGQITESDILLASASDAIVIGFNVRPSVNARAIADREQVEIRMYSIIYDAINEIAEAMEGMLSPEMKEEILGNVEIREIFKISKVGSVAGCSVVSGKITRQSKIRIIREGIVIYSGELLSLKRFKDDVKEVTKGYECGLQIKNYNDIRELDIVESYEEVQVKKKMK
jgi:translation initiation factor IF-2